MNVKVHEPAPHPTSLQAGQTPNFEQRFPLRASAFMSAHQLNPDQSEFIDMIIDHLTDSGIVEPKIFYESPFSDIDDLGIDGVFKRDHVTQIIQIVDRINRAAVAA
ncbi:type I restriction-modification enzyme R subunit C-terminal domain-containing protein [Celeribacter halophilus]|uniref:type I restriction-modification enzyme R subunit C-terminal domain-containing protein n=1 Tax=Celeribacter halophilus TaxID=576117 RepID=UPI0034A54B4C